MNQSLFLSSASPRDLVTSEVEKAFGRSCWLEEKRITGSQRRRRKRGRDTLETRRGPHLLVREDEKDGVSKLIFVHHKHHWPN